MNKIDLESAEKLAKTLLHKNMSEIFATAETNPDLVGEWLRELSAALRFHQGISDQLLEAIEDVRTALRHARPERDNVVSITTLRPARAIG
jgi:hypothetical protein